MSDEFFWVCAVMGLKSVEEWFEGVWADREERLYRGFFGEGEVRVYALPEAVFLGLGKGDVDPRFLTHTVLEYSPAEGNDGKRDWIYVTSGMSNPWGETAETADAKGYSGLGFELVMHTRGARGGRWDCCIG